MYNKKNAHTQAFGQKNNIFSAILLNNGLTAATNKAGGLDRPLAYQTPPNSPKGRDKMRKSDLRRIVEKKNSSGHFRNGYYDYSAIKGQSAKSSNADAVSGISCSRAKFLD